MSANKAPVSSKAARAKAAIAVATKAKPKAKPKASFYQPFNQAGFNSPFGFNVSLAVPFASSPFIAGSFGFYGTFGANAFSSPFTGSFYNNGFSYF